MGEVHQFNKSLENANEDQKLPIWEALYSQWFPDMVSMIAHPKDGWHQRGGIDRSIILSNSKVITLDEKLRDDNFTDIALEYISATSSNSPGWVCKSLACDYIAYAFKPTNKGYLLPVIQLQSAWELKGETWKVEYGVKAAKNKGYNTMFCPVPAATVYKEITRQLVVNPNKENK